MNILVVCTGNTCRSAMAEVFLKERFKNTKIEITSAGTCACDGTVASLQAIAVMKDNGIDLSKHRAMSVSDEAIERADIVVVMEKMHKEYLLKVYPEIEEKIFLFRAFANDGNLETPDPCGQDKKIYEKTLDIIKRSTEGLIKWMEKRKSL